MKEVQDRVVQFSNRYKLTNAETGEILGTFDFDEVTGTVQQVGTEIDKELFDSIANDIAARVVSNGGEISGTIVTFPDVSGTAANVASGDTSATLWGKVKNWFSRLKALAFKDTIRNADVASNAAIAQSKISGLADSLAAKQNTITGAASTIATHNLTDNRALVSNESGKVGVSAVTATELGYLDGVTSNVQTQLNKKYVKPSGGIPASDLAQSVQDSLDKANSALQSAPVTSVNGETGNVEIPLDFLPLSGGNISGNISAQYITGTWLQATAANHQTSAASKIAVFDGSGWLYYRTSAELLSDIGAAAQQTTQGGFQGGEGASATSGGAVGNNASATDGFAGGKSAISEASGAVQLAAGRNKTANTLQFRDYQLCDASGNIPAERLFANSPVRSVNGKTGAVSLSATDVGAATVAQVNSAGMVPYNGHATTLSAQATGGIYEMPDDGYIRVSYQTTTNTNYLTIIQVNSEGTQIWGGLNVGHRDYGTGYCHSFVPVAAGDRVQVSFSSSVKINQIQFIKRKTI